ncbi:MAG TPA: VCBS repeat-containing protein, partial [Kofleriaceae bacterium]|nr:VCBS repeat-containing protein [Kofleriaceae bacterium]
PLAMGLAMLSTTVGCGRIGFDGLADASGQGLGSDASVNRLCFAPRTDLVPCSGVGCVAPTPISVAIGELTGDAKLDLVVGDSTNGIVAVHEGDGSGGFLPRGDYVIDYDAEEVAIADFDESGVPDIAAVAWNTGGVKLYRGLGGGNFASPVALAQASLTIALAVADVDGDGHLDFVTGGENNRVQVVRGIGAGVYDPPITLASATNYYGVAVADVNGDNRKDVVATDGGTGLTVFLQGATVASWTPIAVAVPAGAHGVVTGDWNGDGHTDLAVASRMAGSVAVLLGDGSGMSFSTDAFAVPPEPTWVTEGDLDRDGNLDLVVTQTVGGMVTVALGAGDGTFLVRRDYALDTTAGNGPLFVSVTKAALGDLNGDGYLDIVAANPIGENLGVLLSAPNACAAQ